VLLDRRVPPYLCETTWASGVEMWHVECKGHELGS